jgi:hypothetical protein
VSLNNKSADEIMRLLTRVADKITSDHLSGLSSGDQGYLAENASPARRVRLLKSDSEVHDAFLSFEQYERIKAEAREKRPGPRWTPKSGHTWTPENRPTE